MWCETWGPSHPSPRRAWSQPSFPLWARWEGPWELGDGKGADEKIDCHAHGEQACHHPACASWHPRAQLPGPTQGSRWGPTHPTLALGPRLNAPSHPLLCLLHPCPASRQMVPSPAWVGPNLSCGLQAVPGGLASPHTGCRALNEAPSLTEPQTRAEQRRQLKLFTAFRRFLRFRLSHRRPSRARDAFREAP